MVSTRDFDSLSLGSSPDRSTLSQYTRSQPSESMAKTTRIKLRFKDIVIFYPDLQAGFFH